MFDPCKSPYWTHLPLQTPNIIGLESSEGILQQHHQQLLDRAIIAANLHPLISLFLFLHVLFFIIASSSSALKTGLGIPQCKMVWSWVSTVCLLLAAAAGTRAAVEADPDYKSIPVSDMINGRDRKSETIHADLFHP